jgi:hypothetical protein
MRPNTLIFFVTPARKRETWLRAKEKGQSETAAGGRGRPSLRLEQEGFGEGEAIPARGVVRGDEKGIDRRKGGIQAVEVDDGTPREGVDSLEVLGAKIHAPCLVFKGHDGEPMGAADEGTGRIEEAEAIVEEGTGIAGGGESGPFPDASGFLRGEFGQRRCQGDPLHREEGEMTATGAASGPAGDVRAKRVRHMTAELIDLRHELAVVGKGFR